ncbi:sugar transferase [Desulfatiglans anilini]|uniref:sugar transferase n=1 Tax=Desulfatiglans anilini TaxID=90728 RepID=UPI000409ADA6|nr:sugar transferase [Desulfatiglans anilini]
MALSRFKESTDSQRKICQNSGKRILDLGIAFSALVVLFPLMICIALLVKAKLGHPILFRQLRPGLEGRPFTVYKFRSMNEAKYPDGRLLPDENRQTRIGSFLRATSLDELPALWNVIKGDMSLVGPRPLLMRYLDRYSPEQARRHELKPGITGWAQVNGRNALSWEEKFKLDVWYVDHRSLGLDLKILFMTIAKVVRREGISHPGQATMDEFSG